MKNGFTLIELMIVIAIIVIIAVAAVDATRSRSDVICKAGYKFSIDANDNAAQIIDENGRAIKCESAEYAPR